MSVPGIVDRDEALRARPCPVSMSTSTTAMWTPNGNVGGALNSCVTFSSSSRPSARGSRRRAPPTRATARVSRRRGSGPAPCRGRRRPRSPRGSRRRAPSPARRPRRRRAVAAMPPICVDFEPNVPVPLGTSSVSPLTTVTFSIGSPSRSAAIIAKVVSCPWPCENEPVRTIAPPSAVISTSPNSLLAERVRDLDVRAEPDPELRRAALVAPPPLLRAQLVVAGGAEREVERTLVVARSRTSRPSPS